MRVSARVQLQRPGAKEPLLEFAVRSREVIEQMGPLESRDEARIREIALPLGLVDIKVCAVSDVWSGLKLVIRRDLRE